MAIFEVSGTRAGINTANSPVANLWVPTRKSIVREIGVAIQTAPTTAPLFALQRSTARGTQTTTLTPIAGGLSAPTATTVLDTAWSVNPTWTTAAPYMRGFALPVTAGGGYIWTFPQGIEIASGAGLMLFNVNASGATLGAFAFYFSYEE